MNPNILTFNWHEGYIHLLAKTGYAMDIVGRTIGGIADWMEAFRPVPDNCRIISKAEAEGGLEADRYDCIIAHNLKDLMFIHHWPTPKILVFHNKFRTETALSSEDTNEEDYLKQLRDFLAATANLSLVFISESKKEDWGLEGEVILPGIDLKDYDGYRGDIPKVLRVGNLLREREDIEVVGLVTTVNRAFHRVAMHAVREILLREQAATVDLPLAVICLPHPCTNEEYEAIMRGFIEKANGNGISHMAFGDIFLQDIREYREQMLKGTGIASLFPLWGLSTDKLAHDMIASGLRSIITCVDPRSMPAGFVGREFNEGLLADLPEEVDPCGENGEFHTFTVNGPGFDHSLEVKIGETIVRDGFVYVDVLQMGECVPYS